MLSRTTPLETFLGGMETRLEVDPGHRLRALKPSLVEWKLWSKISSLTPSTALETFLGGMETAEPREEVVIHPQPLKPSLVEWKPTLEPLGVLKESVLETFLGGMETKVPAPLRQALMGP